MTAGAIRYAVDGHIARLTIDNESRRNALNHDMWRALSERVAEANADAQVRVIALSGAGETAFCAGADISEFGGKRTGEDAVGGYDRAVAGAYAAVASSPKPTVAVVRGICFGGGMAVAMSCDIRLVAQDARFRIPAARLGLGYPYESIRSLAHKLGPGAAADILFSARVLDAADALRMGIAQAVWPVAGFAAEAERYLAATASNAPLTLMAAKRALIEIARPEAERDAAAVAALVAACFASDDYREGQRAFREKRDPLFRGA